MALLVSIALNCAMRSTGPAICTQPPFMPGSTRFNSVKLSSPFSWSQSLPENGSKPCRSYYDGRKKRSSGCWRPLLLPKRHRLRRTDCRLEWCRHPSSVGPLPYDGHCRARGRQRGRPVCRAQRAVGKVLQLATPSVIADKNVKLAIGSEPDYATIMIAALDRIGGILLKRV